MSKLGLSITPGSRNGYGPFCTSKPAVVVAVDEGGALGEAWANSGGYTFTVFRDTTVYLEAPPEWNQTSDMVALARLYYPPLKAKWLLNPAEYYTVTNEIGGGEGQDVEANYRKLVTYEREVMRLANLDGFRVCILNHAGGSPGDINIWHNVCLPFILEAGMAGNVYGRHVYGQGDLVGSDGKVIIGNPSRPLEESDILAAAGYRSGIILTECGIDGGYGFAGDRFVAQMKAYEGIIRGKANIIGMACWTAGDWNNANCQDALGALGTYNIANPTPKWTATIPPPAGYKSVVFKLAQEHTVDEWAGIARLAHGEFKRTLTASGDNCVVMVGDGNEQSYAVVFDPDLPSQVETIQQLQAAGIAYQTRYYRVTPPPQPGNPLTGLRLSHILPYRYMLTSPFNAPRDYPPNYKHEGGDFDVIGGQVDNKINVLCTYPGTVDRSIMYGDYGNYIRVTHTRNGSPFYTRYAHLDARFVAVGDMLKAGDPVGEIGATGNALGEHVHFNLEVPGYGLRGYVVDWVVDPEPYMATGRDTLPPIPNAAVIDLLPYILGDGRLYEVQTVGAGQERFQCQTSGNVFWQTKNSQYEELSFDATHIWRGLDISPGPAPSYAERPGALRYYTAKEPNTLRARWCKRFMAIGETFTGPGHYVQFYYQDNCQPSGANSGNATNRTTLKARHASKVWNGITVQDVIEITNGTETWFFARGFGLVAWASAWGSSAISEVHAPGTRPDNVRAVGCWS